MQREEEEKIGKKKDQDTCFLYLNKVDKFLIFVVMIFVNNAGKVSLVK